MACCDQNLSFQSFVFNAEADAGPTLVEPKPTSQDFRTFTSESEALRRQAYVGSMTELTTIYDSISIEYEPEHLIPSAISDISFPQTQSIFSADSTDDFTLPVQKSRHLSASIDDQRSPFKGVPSAPRFPTTPTYAHIFDKSAVKLAASNTTTSSDFFDKPSRTPNGPHASDNLYSLASNVGTAARMRRDLDTF